MNVKLVSYTPNPDQVCDMACRTCTSDDCPKITPTTDKLSALRNALDSGHESVAEHATFTFQVEGVSRITEIQLVRHRLASYSIQSGRYCKRKSSEFVIPESIVIAIKNDLMNGGGWNPSGCLQSDIDNLIMDLSILDERMEKLGVPLEDRRYLYPQGIKTNIVFTMNARELRHFFKLRLCKRAQWEIRELAECMYECVKNIAPVLFEGVGPACIMDGKCKEKKRCDKDE